LKVEPRSGIDHHIIEVPAGDFQQLVDGVIGDMGRANSVGAASTNSPELCCTSMVARKLASSRLKFCSAFTVEY